MTSVLDLSKSHAQRKAHDDLVSWAYDQFKKCKDARIRTEQQWYINLAFYFGKQYVQVLRPGQSGYATGTTRLWIPPAPYWRSRPVINRIRPIVRTELAQMTNNKPNVTIVPASAEDRDMYAAMAGEQVWESTYIQHKLKAVFRRAQWWTLVCGNGYIKSWWDPSLGPVDEETMQPQGDVKFVHETPFHVFVPDLMEEEIENQPYVIHAKTKSSEFVQMNYKTGLDGGDVRAHEAQAREVLDESFLNLVGSQQLQNKQQSVLILEIWIKPGMLPKFPEGGQITVVGNKIVAGFESYPYSHKEYPFAKIDHIPGGKYYATSSVEDLIPLQKEYNRTHGQIIENKNRMGKIQYLYERGTMDPSKITSEPGVAIPYTPGLTPPQLIQPPNLPSYIPQTLDRLLLDFNDISGQHEISQGQVPPGVTAATAISFLQERDETKLSPSFDSMEEAHEKVARHALTFVRDYWTEERIIKVTGPDGSFDALTFKGSDLSRNLDVRTEAGSSLPTSKAAKQALIMDLMKMNFIDPKEGLEVMDMGGITKIYENFQTDERQVQRENMRMAKTTPELIEQFDQQTQMQISIDPTAHGVEPMSGQPVMPLMIPVNTWDNHKLHIEYHNRYRKGQAFESLPPEVKDLFEKHVQQHLMALGLETETMNPRQAAGLPPVDPTQLAQEAVEGEASKPGPDAMPETEMV